MANEEQLAILKQGVEVWNEWREDNSEVVIDLSQADLSEARLNKADLSGANLSEASFTGANLNEAKLSEANLCRAKFLGVDLNKADLSGADLRKAILVLTDLVEANLSGANFMEAILDGVDLRQADLSRANLRGTRLRRTNFSESKFFSAEISFTEFSWVNLSTAIGLDMVIHKGPSHLEWGTIEISEWKIPEVFLRGCGLTDLQIEYVKLENHHLDFEQVSKIRSRISDLEATKAARLSPLFISYSHKDNEFVDKVADCLVKKGIYYWRDIHDLRAGRIEKQIDEAISQDRTVLLVLSENALKSDWVVHEVRKAREVERETGRDILCPVSLDDSWKSSSWPERVMEQIMEYNILDFSGWKDDEKFDDMFWKLLDGLNLFYK